MPLLPLHTFVALAVAAVPGLPPPASPQAPQEGQPAQSAEGPAPPGPANPPAAQAPVPEPVPVPAAESPVPAPAPPPQKIAGFEFQGKLSDPPDKLTALLRSTFPEGTPFVESGPADRVGIPIGTVPRARRALDAIGYDAIVEPRAVPGGVMLAINLRPYDRLRYTFVRCNWPIREDEIQRRISIRSGHALPLPGADRDAAIERERQRLIQFLRGEGYFDANVRIELTSHGVAPASVDFTVWTDLGGGSCWPFPIALFTASPGYPVGPVVVSGNNSIPDAEVETYFRHLDWRKAWTVPPPFRVNQMRADIGKVTERYREIGYPGARVSSSFDPEHSVDRKNKNVAIAIKVNERKRISLAFEGNRSRSASALRDVLTLDEHGSYDDYEAGASADAIQRHYQERGHFFARVQWRRERLSVNEDRLVFVVDEGPQLKVRGVEFVGNEQLPASDLAQVVTVRRFPLLGYIGLGEGGFVTPRQIEFDAERLVEHYRAKGFPDAEVRGEASTSRETLGMIGAVAAGAETVSRDAREIHVRYTVKEGPLVRVASEEFRAEAKDKGPAELPYHPGFLQESLSLRPGDPYTPAQLREDGRRLERLLGDAGYPSGTAEPDVERSGNTVRVLWKLRPGPRVRVGPIFVRGNFVTDPQTILEQIPIRSGDLLTTTAFERGQRNLGFLQLFNNATPISFPGKDEGQIVVPMVVNVEERHQQYNVLHAGIGASTEQKPLDASFPVGFYARLGYDHRNLLGHAWNLGASLNYGLSLFGIAAPLVTATTTFLDRRFFGTLFRFDISGTYFQQATIRLGNIRSWGGSIGFRREMYPGVDAGIHYNLRNTTYDEPLLRFEGANGPDRTIKLGTTVGSFTVDLQLLRLDHRLVPARGYKIDAIAEIAPRALSFGYADASFIKMGLRSTVVIPLLPWLSLRHGLRYDQGFPLGGRSLLPKTERYFAGGDTTIRGFGLDRARVEEVYFVNESGAAVAQYRPLGGNLRILQNLDLQFAIAHPWYGSIFMDNGVVADSLEGLGAHQFRHGVGIAPFIFKLPIGDLSFAGAWALDPRAGDTGLGLRFPVFHVNIGLMF